MPYLNIKSNCQKSRSKFVYPRNSLYSVSSYNPINPGSKTDHLEEFKTMTQEILPKVGFSIGEKPTPQETLYG